MKQKIKWAQNVTSAIFSQHRLQYDNTSSFTSLRSYLEVFPLSTKQKQQLFLNKKGLKGNIKIIKALIF